MRSSLVAILMKYFASSGERRRRVCSIKCLLRRGTALACEGVEDCGHLLQTYRHGRRRSWRPIRKDFFRSRAEIAVVA